MAELKPFEQIDAGGVDSRSNPLNLPRNRALRCLNWVPKQAGFWELRWGYSTVTMSTVSASAITGLFPYRTLDGHKYVLFMQGTTLKTLDTATGTVTTPTVKGAAIASAAKGMGAFANNRFHYGNGTDQKWFDGTTWRTSGLPALTFAQVQNVTVTEGVRELTSTEASTITLTAAAGGSFAADTLTGHIVYVALFDTATNEIGPATISVGSGRIKLTLNQKFTVANMPTPSTATWVKLIAGTIDGGNLAWFFTNTSTVISTIACVATTMTVVANGHGLSTGDVVKLTGIDVYFAVGLQQFDRVFAVTVVDANTFTVTISASSSASIPVPGATVKRIVKAANATASVDVLASTQDTSYQVNQNLGLAASTVGGTQPGYQLYASIYNPNGGVHVGNRIIIGGRALQTGYRSNWRIAGLPDLSGTDTEWTILIGRTGDGTVTPYAAADNAVNWAVVPSAQTTFTLNQANIDNQHELPTRNGIIPSQCNMFCLAGDFVYAADTSSPFLRRSGDLSKATERGNTFTGRPEQSWAPNDVDTFPTAEAVTGMFEIDQEVFMGTLHDSALSVNLAGIQQWVGPWPIGIGGRRAGTKCGSHGFYWVTGDKQIATFSQGVPVVVSEEYELAELSQIGDAFLSTTECVYYRSTSKDELRIEAQKTDGTPYTIIHDFKLREVYSAPGSLYGQGYSSQYVGALATVFTSALVRDGNGRLQIYSGASTGQLYQLYSGADDVGNQYSADLILLVNGGTQRTSVPFIDWYGDGNIDVSSGQTLSTSLAAGAQFAFEQLTPLDNPAQVVPGSENDFLFRAYFTTPEVQHKYVRFQLTSHSADGNLNLNNPPHVPLESYGRLYELIPAVGDERER